MIRKYGERMSVCVCVNLKKNIIENITSFIIFLLLTKRELI